MPARTASPAQATPRPLSAATIPDHARMPVATTGYRGLKVWQRAMDLVASVHLLTKSLPDDECVLRDDLRRSAMTVPAQIAAGNSLYRRSDYMQHLSAAHGAAAHVECLLQMSDRLGVLAARDTVPLMLLAADVSRMLRSLARALQPAEKGGEVEPLAN